MYTDWTKNLKTPEDKESFENTLLGSKLVLDRLVGLIDEYEKSLGRSEIDVQTFNSPGWDYRQAYKNGYRACLAKMKELVTLDQRQ